MEEELGYIEEYRARLNGGMGGFEVVIPRDAPGERTYPVSEEPGSDVIRPGLNRLELAARDMSGKITSLTVLFRVTLEQ